MTLAKIVTFCLRAILLIILPHGSLTNTLHDQILLQFSWKHQFFIQSSSNPTTLALQVVEINIQCPGQYRGKSVLIWKCHLGSTLVLHGGPANWLRSANKLPKISFNADLWMSIKSKQYQSKDGWSNEEKLALTGMKIWDQSRWMQVVACKHAVACFQVLSKNSHKLMSVETLHLTQKKLPIKKNWATSELFWSKSSLKPLLQECPATINFYPYFVATIQYLCIWMGRSTLSLPFIHPSVSGHCSSL